MTNIRCFSPTGFAIASLLCLALISNTSSAAATSASSSVAEDKLAKIEKMLDQANEQFKHQNYEGLALPILNSLEQLSASTKTDKVLFLILRLKIAIGTLIDAKGYLKADERTAVESYFEKHKSEYNTFFSVTYQDNADFKALITKYPNSPFVPEAAFLMATEKGSMGECEADVDCHIGRSIDAYLPYIQAYLGHNKNRLAIEYINRDLESVTYDPQKNGLWEIHDLDVTATLLKKYHEVVKTIADPALRAEALYPLARIFISAGEFKLANSIYNDLESHNSEAFGVRS